MIIRDIFDREVVSTLTNQGQTRITSVMDDAATEELRYELATFVCEGQYARGLEMILNAFLSARDSSSQTGAWVSGFFGSGKSHLLKVAAHLWCNTQFRDGQTARNLVQALPESIREHLVELDRVGIKTGGMLAAAGAMPSGSSDHVRLTILGIVLKAVGLPENFTQARFCLWLHSEGAYDKVREAIEASGRVFLREVANLHVSPHLATAAAAAIPGLGDERSAREAFKVQFTRQIGDITSSDFVSTAKEALLLRSKSKEVPCVLLILDEVQQYIGNSYDRSVNFTEAAETLQKEFDRRVMIVAAGQSALTDVEMLKKLLDRFRITVRLSDSDVETVTRRVLLHKKPSARPTVTALFDRCGGEISRQLDGTKIAARREDDQVAVDDYPLLPARRRFWEECFRQIDAAGTSSQLRSQLRIIHDAISKLADQPVGRVIPADELFDALAEDMVNTGVLLREISDRIYVLGQTDRLAGRVCSVIFLISKLKQDTPTDIGVRAIKSHIADLLIDDISTDTGKFRNYVAEKLEALATGGDLMKVGEEYRLQTREGTEWDRDFRERAIRIAGDETTIQLERDSLIYGNLQKTLQDGKFLQGKAKVPRKFNISHDVTPPASAGPDIPVWIRDGWSSAEKEMLAHLRKVGVDDALIGVFVPQSQANDLKRWIVEAKAAEETLHARGNPTTEAGREAQAGIASRLARAEQERQALASDVANRAKVFLGGGSEELAATLKEKAEKARDESLGRLFPRFREADSALWHQVIARVKNGSDEPFEPVGYKDDVGKHPVSQEVLRLIGPGKLGAEIRRELARHPWGWPQDSIDATLGSGLNQHQNATTAARATADA